MLPSLHLRQGENPLLINVCVKCLQKRRSDDRGKAPTMAGEDDAIREEQRPELPLIPRQIDGGIGSMAQ